ncbi:hypothetical protein OH77DRAFT_1496599 [Trametes cingulata]|nr:hypothetical protein OH77DRAFT_1496599 [Trametes cingulata]
MALTSQSSRTRPSRTEPRLAQGLREKSSWFVHNIITARPEVRVRAGPRILRRQPHTTRLYGTKPLQLQVMVARQEVSSDASAEEAHATVPSPLPFGKTLKSVRRMKRISGRAVVALNIVNEERDSDSEDLGRVYSMIDEDASMPSEYHTAISHFTDLSGLADTAVPQLVDESSGAVFARVCCSREERSVSATGSFAGEWMTPQATAARVHPMTEATPHLLAVPSLMLTLPTPQIAHSPVFRPRSPITLSKYVEATTPTYMPNPLSLSPSTSMSPAPSVPSCDRCCLAQLEYGLICRPCEKQWLACKMWYQAHDGGRRRWLTEPYIKPAESTASIRAVMGVLGVPGSSDRSHSNRGLGFGSSVSFKKELPFRVLATTSNTSSSHVHSGTRSGGFRSWATRSGTPTAKRVLLVRQDTLVAARKTRAVLRALWSASVAVLLPGPVSRNDRSSVPSRSTSDDSSATSWAGAIGGHRRPSSRKSKGSLSSGSAGFACITSSSRFVEHLL